MKSACLYHPLRLSLLSSTALFVAGAFAISACDDIAMSADGYYDLAALEGSERELIGAVDRDATVFRVRLKSPGRMRWVLKGENGTCAEGWVGTGSQTIEVPKVSTSDDLELSFFSEQQGGSELERLRFSRLGNISTLSKPKDSGIVYQLPIRTFFARGNGMDKTGRLNDVSDSFLKGLKNFGVDYVWLTGVQEHANPRTVDPDVVKGEAGSYYAIRDQWDVSPDLGTLSDFDRVIELAHANGLRVLLDLVVNHTARDHQTDVACKHTMNFGSQDQKNFRFHAQNSFYYLGAGTRFEPPSPRMMGGQDGVYDTDLSKPDIQFEEPAKVTGNDVTRARPNWDDWYETAKLNYGWDVFDRRPHYEPRPRTWEQMLDVAKYWVRKGVDGFRVDFAHAVPMEFWRYFIYELRKINPNVYLVAEAYEEDAMRLPGFSYQAMLEAGFDSVYNSKMYWNLYRQSMGEGSMGESGFRKTPGFRHEIVSQSGLLTHYMENHDERRMASTQVFPHTQDRLRKAWMGYNYSVYSALLPGYFLIHGGQEVGEDASVWGAFAGDNGRTSIFDFVFQPWTKLWLEGDRSEWLHQLRDSYGRLNQLKKTQAFLARNNHQKPTYWDLDPMQLGRTQSRWVTSYLRTDSGETYLVVLNSDPRSAHDVTIHFTDRDAQDSYGILRAMGVENSERRFIFEEVLNRVGWEPTDPGVGGRGLPGWVLYRSGNVPSGLFLGSIAPGTSYVFRLKRL